MTQRMDPNTRVKIVTSDPFGSVVTTTLAELYGMCSWRETGDDLDLEAALRRDGRRTEPGWRTISLVPANTPTPDVASSPQTADDASGMHTKPFPQETM